MTCEHASDRNLADQRIDYLYPAVFLADRHYMPRAGIGYFVICPPQRTHAFSFDRAEKISIRVSKIILCREIEQAVGFDIVGMLRLTFVGKNIYVFFQFEKLLFDITYQSAVCVADVNLTGDRERSSSVIVKTPRSTFTSSSSDIGLSGDNRNLPSKNAGCF